ncbi:hypothetical protein [Vulcanisaeta sp. JCM 16159]|uniref:hypothetical protein n=1 Tax=Vulcanisaeta sp. JCM 16159 TaxID=1295371 RepID=UPI0006D2A93F|nr:hypothetical protein [Vulcanisaeta sp. JCM 16159]
MRVLKIAYFEIKQMYRRWYSILPSLFIAIIGSFSIVITGNPKIILDYLSFLIIVMILTSYVPLRYYSITKSVIDFVFTTQIDPVEYYIANAIAAGLLYPIFLIAFTVFTVRLNPTIIYCLLNALILSGFFVLFTSNVRMGSWRSKLLLSAPILTVICLGFLKPEISPLYGS